MSTHSEIIDLGMSRLGRRRSTEVRRDLVTEINSFLKRLSRQSFKPWFLMDMDTLTFEAGEVVKPLADDFSLEVEASRPFFTYDGEVEYLQKLSYAMLEGQTGTKNFYAIEGNNIHIRPTPSEQQVVSFLYYKNDEGELVDNAIEATNLWLVNAEDWIVNSAASRVARFHTIARDLAQDLADDAREFKTELYVLHEARKHQNMDYYVGGASDGS